MVSVTRLRRRRTTAIAGGEQRSDGGGGLHVGEELRRRSNKVDESIG